MTRKRFALALGTIAGLLGILAAAPLWAPAIGLGPPPPPAPGKIVTITAGYRMNVIDEGKGPAVVLIHGLPGSAYDWRPLPELLVAAGYRVIRYDRVGYGHSDRRRADGDHRLDANAEELLQLLSQLHLDAPVLVGWSYGGGVALRAAAEASGRIGALLLLGSMGPSTRMAVPPAFVEPLQRWGVASGFPARLGVRLLGRQTFGDMIPDWWPDHALSVVALPGTVHTWMMEARHTDVTALRPERVTVPVMVVHGSADRISPPSTAVDLHRQLRASVLVEVAGGGHMLPNTHAALVVENLNALAICLRGHEQLTSCWNER